MSFKIGDKVVCMDASGSSLFKGFTYEVKDVCFGGAEITVNGGDDRSWRRSRFALVEETPVEQAPEYTGSSVSYYKVDVKNPTSGGEPYTLECNDIIESLSHNFAEGNIQKALFRLTAAKKFGNKKKGYTDAIYDLEKIIFFANRLLAVEKANLVPSSI